MMISILPESALFKALSGFFFAMRSILWVYFGGYLT